MLYKREMLLISFSAKYVNITKSIIILITQNSIILYYFALKLLCIRFYISDAKCYWFKHILFSTYKQRNYTKNTQDNKIYNFCDEMRFDTRRYTLKCKTFCVVILVVTFCISMILWPDEIYITLHV